MVLYFQAIADIKKKDIEMFLEYLLSAVRFNAQCSFLAHQSRRLRGSL